MSEHPFVWGEGGGQEGGLGGGHSGLEAYK